MKCVNCGVSNKLVKVCEYCGSPMNEVVDEANRGSIKSKEIKYIHMVNFPETKFNDKEVIDFYSKVKGVAESFYPTSQTYLAISTQGGETSLLTNEELQNQSNLSQCAQTEGGLIFTLKVNAHKKWNELFSALSKLTNSKLMVIGQILDHDDSNVQNFFKDGQLVDGFLKVSNNKHLYDDYIEEMENFTISGEESENWCFETISEEILNEVYY